tara:strand:- start:266 stop:445 length:180 start_codon:yes stop_codon:yes gene_type:complete
MLISMEETINGNIYEHNNYTWYGVGYIKMNDLVLISSIVIIGQMLGISIVLNFIGEMYE